MKGFSKGITMVEALIVGAIGAMGVASVVTLLKGAEKSKELSEAKANVEGIAKVMQSSVSAMPKDAEGYKQLLSSKWPKPIDPWGNYYRMIVYPNTHLDLCSMTTTGFHVELPEGRLIKDVLYVVWTRPEKMPDTGEYPQLQRDNVTNITDYKTMYAKANGTLKLTRDTIFSLYTLDMYRAKHCLIASSATVAPSPLPPSSPPQLQLPSPPLLLPPPSLQPSPPSSPSPSPSPPAPPSVQPPPPSPSPPSPPSVQPSPPSPPPQVGQAPPESSRQQQRRRRRRRRFGFLGAILAGVTAILGRRYISRLVTMPIFQVSVSGLIGGILAERIASRFIRRRR